MQKIIKNSVLLFSFSLISFCILYYPKIALFYALMGLDTWYERMIPTLFPFMVLTGIIVRLQLSEGFTTLLRPFLFPLLHLPNRCLYVVIIGFLCGFPMGAKITADMYRLNQLTKREATYLLSFCNNIGPVFFTGFVLTFLPKSLPVSGYFFGMYGIPLCYGIFLRYTYYKSSFSPLNIFYRQPSATQKPPTFAAALDDSVSSGIQSITKLGGYMIFFSLLNLFPQLFFSRLPANIQPLQIFCSLLLEITSGIASVGTSHPVLMLSMLHFGGISCLAQTYSMISDTDIPLLSYVFHKCIQTILALIYYKILFVSL